VRGAALSDRVMGVKEDGRASACRKSRRDQQSRTVHIHQIGGRLVQQRANRGDLRRYVRRESQNVGCGLPAASIRTGPNLVDAHTACAKKIDQRSAGRNCHARIPPPLLNRRH